VTKRFVTRAGSVVITERSDALPIVGISATLRSGTLLDPAGKEGLVRMLGRGLRMGTSDVRGERLEEKLDELGAQLSIGASQSFVNVGGVVVASNLEPFIELLADVLLRPAMRDNDLRQVRRELRAELAASCDDDRSLCFRHLRSHAFPDQLQGRPRSGTLASLGRITRSDLVKHHKRHVTGPNLVFGVWGDFAPRRLAKLLDQHFGGLPKRAVPKLELPEPHVPRGRRILIVDKPERSQTQIAVATLGSHPGESSHIPLIVGNTAFGGLFSSRLNEEVRVKRGLSYGASSSLTVGKSRDLWAMHTFPSAKDAVSCLQLQLDLFDRWVAGGITADELQRSKSYLEKSHAFEVDTPSKRLDQDLDIELLGFPKRYHSHFVQAVKRVGLKDVKVALKQGGLALGSQVIVIVATAKELKGQLAKIPNVTQIETVPFDRV
jgi:zinc protease